MTYNQKASAALSAALPGWTYQGFHQVKRGPFSVQLHTPELYDQWTGTVYLHPGMCGGMVVIGRYVAPAQTDPAEVIHYALDNARSGMAKMSDELP